MEIVREVTLEEARPGDRVTLVGTLTDKDDTMPGAYVDEGVLCLFDGADTVVINERVMTVAVERVTQVTDQEPQGLGAVVRTVREIPSVYVRHCEGPDVSALWMCYTKSRIPHVAYTWDEVLSRSDCGAVEVLDEGWTP